MFENLGESLASQLIGQDQDTGEMPNAHERIDSYIEAAGQIPFEDIALLLGPGGAIKTSGKVAANSAKAIINKIIRKNKANVKRIEKLQNPSLAERMGNRTSIKGYETMSKADRNFIQREWEKFPSVRAVEAKRVNNPSSMLKKLLPFLLLSQGSHENYKEGGKVKKIKKAKDKDYKGKSQTRLNERDRQLFFRMGTGKKSKKLKSLWDKALKNMKSWDAAHGNYKWASNMSTKGGSARRNRYMNLYEAYALPEQYDPIYDKEILAGGGKIDKQAFNRLSQKDKQAHYRGTGGKKGRAAAKKFADYKSAYTERLRKQLMEGDHPSAF